MALGYTVLQFPSNIALLEAGHVSELIYGRVYEEFFTEAAGANADIVAELGFGPAGTDPRNNPNWQWSATAFNTQFGNDDEYQGSLNILSVGNYSYTYRFAKLVGGILSDWTYADLDGNGSNPGLSFDLGQLGTVTVGYNEVNGTSVGEDLPGTAADDLIRGFQGRDTLDGLEGDDRLLGDQGNDTLTGGPGDDLLDGGDDSDTASYLTAPAGVTVDLAIVGVPQDTIGAGMDNFVSIENLTGSTFDDILYGDSGPNTLNGKQGADVLVGRSGDDRYFVDNAGDEVYETTGIGTGGDAGGTDTILSTVSFSLNTHGGVQFVENLTLLGGGNRDGSGNGLTNFITGNSGNNRLDGREGDDTLKGNAGLDLLIGGPGRDAMYGGVDGVSDTFLFRNISETATGAQRDVVIDFVSGIDLIDLRLIDADTTVAGNQAFAFSTTGAAAHSIWFSVNGANIIVRGDVDGNATHDFEILVKDIGSVVAGDFLL